jgi:hypothetical protein
MAELPLGSRGRASSAGSAILIDTGRPHGLKAAASRAVTASGKNPILPDRPANAAFRRIQDSDNEGS